MIKNIHEIEIKTLSGSKNLDVPYFMQELEISSCIARASRPHSLDWKIQYDVPKIAPS